ncbi:N-acetylglucosaminyltransferase [Gordoniibacillus kamchatkensis]|uniref:N-acetylglucosaminyltransferase n=1 Tax=Gordoniibacillus kamchatkensis TaxID=1590651 RepID=A0ABR5AK96_9BACL|nr:glycosyltransferase [Paenibacillus sp. VKM B-2647]KIL41273.1 N-acetylglucosaminyltransferase [Paenibacillus sp. VKM B-2647]
MTVLISIVSVSFCVLLLYYSLLTVAGVLFRAKKPKPVALIRYPSVAVLIPAHNEGVVVADTLHAMSKLQYPGDVHVYLLNDGSQDETGEIAQFYADSFANFHHIQVPTGTPRGKPRVLNYGISISESEYIAVYDADNQPEPQALKLLMEAAETTPKAVGAVGYVKTINESKNALTRMIALEFSAFQLLMQAGRWHLFRLGSLTGTNLIVRRDALEQAGGYDPYALAEDADLTLTLTDMGGLLPIVPEARTWEQEPETFFIWLRQRTRWMQGNLYLIGKTLRNPRLLAGRNWLHSVQLLAVYIGFVFFLLVSDAWFVLGLFGRADANSAAPLLIVWFESWLVYAVQLVTAQMSDKPIRPADLLVSFFMYFTYAQLWLYLLLRGLFFQLKLKWFKREPVWDKTERFKQGKNMT